jgi:hypothetical protein
MRKVSVETPIDPNKHPQKDYAEPFSQARRWSANRDNFTTPEKLLQNEHH